MALQFFNTLSRQKEEFVPLNPPAVKLYTCGPTVYNYAHIGNFRTYVFEDLLRRYLEYKGYQVMHVMNITDVEDKIIRTVREQKISLTELTTKFTQAFFEDRDTLGIKPAHQYPRATEHIQEMFRLIETLLAKGIAYRSEDGSIYYSIAKFANYGALAHLHPDELKPGVRVKQDEYEKEAATDFALWKAWDEKDGEVGWDSPWGRGRPGWHLECSAMAMKYLGEELDIHCGGVDNIFPHHQNEIAQSEPCTGKTFVKYWLHSSHLRVEDKKMSKSLGNFYTLRDLLAKGWGGREIRYELINAHYRLPVNFTMEGIEGARSALGRIDEVRTKLKEVAGETTPGKVPSAEVDRAMKGFEEALDDDLNVSGALGVLFEFVRETNRRLGARNLSAEEAAGMLAAWDKFDAVIGFGAPPASEIPAEIQQLVEERLASRKAKNFKRADEIRAELTKRGWILEDTPQGARVKKV